MSKQVRTVGTEKLLYVIFVLCMPVLLLFNLVSK